MVDAHDHRYTLARYLCDRTRPQHQPRPTSFHRENASPTLFSLFPRNRFDPRWPYFLLSLSIVCPTQIWFDCERRPTAKLYSARAYYSPLSLSLSLSLSILHAGWVRHSISLRLAKISLAAKFLFSSPLSLSLMGREIFVLSVSPISWIVH